MNGSIVKHYPAEQLLAVGHKSEPALNTLTVEFEEFFLAL